MHHLLSRRLRPRTPGGRLFAFALAAAIAAIGACAVPGLKTEGPDLAGPGMPVDLQLTEPGVFDLPLAKPARTAETPAPEPVSAPAQPAHDPKPVTRQASLPAGVERFDACKPACESRDPAVQSLPETASPATTGAAAPVVPPGGTILRPPLPIRNDGMAARPAAPGLIERTVAITRTTLAGMTDQLASAFGAQ